MTSPDPRFVIDALADPHALIVFAAIVIDTDPGCEKAKWGYDRSGGGVSYITPFGLAKKTGLDRPTIEQAAARLQHAGLLIALPDDERGYESWRINHDTFPHLARNPPHG